MNGMTSVNVIGSMSICRVPSLIFKRPKMLFQGNEGIAGL